MVNFDRINISEDTDGSKTSASKGFKFQPNFCNECHDVLMMSMNLDNIADLNTRGVNYCCIFNGINKSEAVNLLQNADLSKKCRTL